LNADLALVEEWALSKNLKISPEKSSVTLLTPDPHQTSYHPQVYLQGSLVPLAKTAKWLGINVDTKINSSYHVSDIIPKLSRCIKIMQALAGSTFGQCKETLVSTYKALLRPVMENGCQIWAPNASDTSIKRLQVVQNKALHVATGGHMSIPIAHLHRNWSYACEGPHSASQ
jgi:hypothetical protein